MTDRFPVLVLLLLSMAPAWAAPPPVAEHLDRLIVHWRETAEPAADRLAAAAARSGLPGIRPGRRIGRGIGVVHLPHPVDRHTAEAYAKRLGEDPAVVAAQPDHRLLQQASPDDPLYDRQWNLRPPVEAAGAIDAEAAWDTTSGDPDVTVAVIDTGLLEHRDLVARVYRRAVPAGDLPYGFDFISQDRFLIAGDQVESFDTANDGDGRDLDPRDPGDWLSVDDIDREPFLGYGCTRPAASSWHGTFVAGVIGAAGDNGSGIAGVDWRSSLLPVRALGKCGGNTSDVLAAVLWAAGLPVCSDGEGNVEPGCVEPPANEHPARIINLSLGGAVACGPIEQEVYHRLAEAGVSVVAAAGNAATDVAGFTPAGCDGVLAVAAVGADGALASYSNFGAAIALAAPGGDTLSGQLPVLSTGNSGTTVPSADRYVYAEGTSMAAPHVSGVLALMLAANHERSGRWLSRAVLERKLLQSTRAFPSGTGNDCATERCGAGLLDAGRAVRAVATPPTVTVADAAAAPGVPSAITAVADDDGDLVSYRWQVLDDAELVLQGADTATLRFTPPAHAAESGLRFRVTVTDDVNLSTSRDVAVTVTAAAPVFTPVPDVRVAIAQTAVRDVEARQADGGFPQLALEQAPAGAEFDDAGDGKGRFRWTPLEPGRYPIIVRALDAEDPQISSTLTFDVVAFAAERVAGTPASGGGGAAGVALWAAVVFPVVIGRRYFRKLCFADRRARRTPNR